MAEQMNEQMSEYEKFRLLKLANRNDDDNFSAHFSNVSANISMYTKSERQIKINSFRSTNQNEQDFLKNTQPDSKTYQLQSITKKYCQLEEKYNELIKMYKLKQEQAQKYKKLYNEELNREKQTKQKLKNWVKQAKTNLNQ